MPDAIALLEFDSVASGLSALNTLVKRAPVSVLEANLVEPGKYLILFVGGVAEVQESVGSVVENHDEALLSQLFLPGVHPALVAGLRGHEDHATPDTVGVVEGHDVSGTLAACDRVIKDTMVSLSGIRVAVGLGGRAYFVVAGLQHDVEEALLVATAILQDRDVFFRAECICRPHDEMVPWLLRKPPFQLGR
jgi:microcompartment protein CcmL/EutN